MREYRYKFSDLSSVLMSLLFLSVGAWSLYIGYRDHFLFYNVFYLLLGVVFIFVAILSASSIGKDPQIICISGNDLILPKGPWSKKKRIIKISNIKSIRIDEMKLTGKDYLFIKKNKGVEYAYIKDAFVDNDLEDLFANLSERLKQFQFEEGGE